MLDFNAQEVKSLESTGFEPVPAGDYNVVVDRAEMVDTKAGGKGIKLTYQIIDGDYANRLVFDFINYEHPTSQVAQDIGRSDLKDLCYATGELKLSDLSQLLHKPFIMGVKVVKDTYKGDGSMKNERGPIHLVKSVAEQMGKIGKVVEPQVQKSKLEPDEVGDDLPF